jgi:DNA-binding response OmpR family regulator
MTLTSDGNPLPSTDSPNESTQRGAGMQPRILVVDTDRALLALLEEWLDVCGWCVASDQDHAATACTGRFDVLIVDVPHPKRGGVELLQQLAARHPGAPIIALSSTFFPGVETTGGVARTLGVACVLPKPVARESLIAAVRSLLPR